MPSAAGWKAPWMESLGLKSELICGSGSWEKSLTAGVKYSSCSSSQKVVFQLWTPVGLFGATFWKRGLQLFSKSHSHSPTPPWTYGKARRYASISLLIQKILRKLIHKGHWEATGCALGQSYQIFSVPGTLRVLVIFFMAPIGQKKSLQVLVVTTRSLRSIYFLNNSQMKKIIHRLWRQKQ